MLCSRMYRLFNQKKNTMKEIFFRKMLINIVKIIEYTRCWHVQPGVAERSDAGDRMRHPLSDSLQSMFIENI